MLLIGVAAAIAALGASRIGAAERDLYPGIREAISTWVKTFDVPGASLAVIDPKGKIRRRSYRGMDATEPARIASLSKAITAVCVARLIDDGKLSFTTAVHEVLAPIIERYGIADARLGRVTIAQLITHESGLPREPKPRARSGTLADSVRKVLGTPLEREPGSGMAYSNAGYMLLGAIIESVSGAEYGPYCARRVLAPMGLHGSIDPELRHRASNGGWRISAVDYAKFAQVWDKHSAFLGPQSREWQDGRVRAASYGLGTRLKRTERGVRYWHSGSVALRTGGGAFVYKVENGWTVVVIFDGKIERKGRRALPAAIRNAVHDSAPGEGQ